MLFTSVERRVSPLTGRGSVEGVGFPPPPLLFVAQDWMENPQLACEAAWSMKDSSCVTQIEYQSQAAKADVCFNR